MGEKLPNQAPPSKAGVPRPDPTPARPPHIPLSRVREIIKADGEIKTVSEDAVFSIARSTESWVAEICEGALGFASLEKRKTIELKDLAAVVRKAEGGLDFVADVFKVPKPKARAPGRRSNSKKGKAEEQRLKGPRYHTSTTAIGKAFLKPTATVAGVDPTPHAPIPEYPDDSFF